MFSFVKTLLGFIFYAEILGIVSENMYNNKITWYCCHLYWLARCAHHQVSDLNFDIYHRTNLSKKYDVNEKNMSYLILVYVRHHQLYGPFFKKEKRFVCF